ncbi:MAG: DUF928 domain-containing protein [Cyanobacteriota bacterium]|nr:DUF928 domain-containing protein [Cyanobacteriota bacterium]
MLRPRHLGVSAACTSLSFLVQLASLANGMPEQTQPLARMLFNRAVVAERAKMTARKSFFVLPVDSTPRRSQGSGRCYPLNLLETALLIPSKEVAGQTVSGHPSFFLYLPESVPVPIEVTLSLPGGFDPIYQARIESPVAGILKIELPADRPELSGEEIYLWAVSFICNEKRPSANPFYFSWIERVPMTPELEAALAAATTERDRARAYAQAGAWYDALATLYEAQQDNPDDPELQADWNAMLVEVGLTEAVQKRGDRDSRAKKRNLRSTFLSRGGESD